MRAEWNAGTNVSGILVVLFVFAAPGGPLRGQMFERRHILWGRS